MTKTPNCLRLGEEEDFDLRLIDDESLAQPYPIDEWNVINALDRIQKLASGSKLSDQFWYDISSPLEYLVPILGLKKVQIVFLAILVETGDSMTWRNFARFLNCSRLYVMTFTDDIEEMIRMGWMDVKGRNEVDSLFDGFFLAPGVITALRHNKRFEPESFEGFSEQEFVDRLESRMCKSLNSRDITFCQDVRWMMRMVRANQQLPLCQELMKLDCKFLRAFMLMVVFDYTQSSDTEDEGLPFNTVNNLFPEDFACNYLRRSLRDGSNILFQKGLVEYKCQDGLTDTDTYVLTRKSKSELLSGYNPPCKKRIKALNTKGLRSYTTINEKKLFYNNDEQKQFDKLVELLSPENFKSVQQRLDEEGMRKGFACLFYGGPGTGKTESVLQIARMTGRDIIQVDIASMKNKFVGESEKNIKEIFTNYREICKNRDIAPILFFNEADAIINKRITDVDNSVEKMDNAMQNIILKELENLDGILIATTNLTSNLDNAFERRFLYKIEFHKPEADVRAKIWQCMLKDISYKDAKHLASSFDFSGGQIENIARKRTVDYIITGKKPTINDLEAYCKNELISKVNNRNHVAGFS